MPRLRMVPLAKVPDSFGARVLVARMGAEGIVTQLRGGGIDGPYPVGNVEVLVSDADLEVARELLLADEIESAFDKDDDGIDADDDDDDDETTDGQSNDEGPTSSTRRPPLAPWLVLAVVVGLALFAYVNTVGYHAPPPGRDVRPSGQGP